MNTTSVSVNRLDNANATASGNIPKDVIDSHIEALASKYAKTMKIDGFRRGKVPVSLVKDRYKQNLKEESRQKSIDDFYAKAISELKLESKDVIGQPLISKFDESESGIDIELKIGITPTFEIDNIMDCIPTFTLDGVEDSKVDERLEQMAKARAPIVESGESELKDGLIANINFEGFIDDVAFDGGKAEHFDLLIGSGQFIAGFEESLVGMKVGEDREINVRFPDDYQATNLAGKDAKFKVKLNAIKKRESVKIDDVFAKSLMSKEEAEKEENQKEGAALSQLRERIKKELEIESRTKLYNEKLKEEALKNIADKYSFDLPNNIIEQEMNVLFNNELSTLSKEKLDELRDSKDKSKDLFEAQREKASMSVKVTFIIDRLSKQEKVSVEDNEVFQTIYYDAMMSGHNPQEVIESYRKNNLLPAVKMAMIEDKVVTHLLNKKNGVE